MTIKFMGVRPYTTTSTTPAIFTWDGSTIANIGTQPSVSAVDSEWNQDASKGTARAIWFDGKLYALLGEDIYETADAATWSVSQVLAVTSTNYWQGGLFVHYGPITSDATVKPRLFCISCGSGSYGITYQVWYKEIGGSWAMYSVSTSVSFAGVARPLPYGGGNTYGYPSLRLIGNKVWGGMSETNAGASDIGALIWAYDPATDTQEVIGAGAYTGSTSEGNAQQPVRWLDNVYWTARKSDTVLALYRYSAGIAIECVEVQTGMPSNPTFYGWDNMCFVDAAENDLICFSMTYTTGNFANPTTHLGQQGVWKCWRVSESGGSYTLEAELTATVFAGHAELTNDRIRQFDKWSLYLDTESGSGTTTRTPTPKLFYRPTDYAEGYQVNEIPLHEFVWNGIGSAMTETSASAGTGWWDEQSETAGNRTFDTDQCMPIITSVTPGADKITVKCKLYLTGSSTTTGWIVSLYFRKAGEAYAVTRAALTGTPSQTAASLAISSNTITGVLANTLAGAPAELTFEWDLSAAGAPVDSEKVAIVLYAHQ